LAEGRIFPAKGKTEKEKEGKWVMKEKKKTEKGSRRKEKRKGR
jgi:hypothetical protein